MSRYNIVIPIAGALFFDGIEADSEESAIEQCIELIDNSDNPIDDFEGTWDTYKKLVEGNRCYARYTEIEVYKLYE